MPDNKQNISDINNNNFNAINWITVNGEKQIATLNLIKGNNVYGEKLVKYNGDEYRIWDPFRSKLAGALKKGLKNLPILAPL
jgi:fibrillarin-like pre-rRNA processing protein